MSETYLEMVKRHNAMEAEEKQAFNFIWNAIQAGDSFGKFVYWDNYRGKPYYYPMFDDVLWIGEGYRGVYIYWRNFGSSASKNNKTDLRWIIEHIFKTTAVDFLKTYTSRKAFQESTAREDIRGMIEKKAAEIGVENPLQYCAVDSCVYNGGII